MRCIDLPCADKTGAARDCASAQLRGNIAEDHDFLLIFLKADMKPDFSF